MARNRQTHPQVSSPPRKKRPAKKQASKRSPLIKENKRTPHDLDEPLSTGSTAPGISQNLTIEMAIGRQVRRLRKKHDMTVIEIAKQTGLSIGMLSKIENGVTSPSLTTLQTLAEALNVPITTFFAPFEEQRDITFVSAGNGLMIERRGTKAGHRYQLLGHSVRGNLVVEPYLITFTKQAKPYKLFQHAGTEFIYMLSGEVVYRHGDKSYLLTPGDSIFFDAEAPHGPEDLRVWPIQYLSIIVYPRT